jgi:hypothetical protein
MGVPRESLLCGSRSSDLAGSCFDLTSEARFSVYNFMSVRRIESPEHR